MAQKIDSLRSQDGFLAAALIDSTSGMIIESIDNGAFPIETAAAYNTQVVQAKLKAMDAVGLGDDKIEDILITLGTQYHLIRPLASNQELFLYLALDRKSANLGMVRLELKKVDGTIKK